MAGKYVGFNALKAKIEAEGNTPAAAGAITAAIGRKKYGKKRMARAAATGEPAPKVKG